MIASLNRINLQCWSTLACQYCVRWQLCSTIAKIIERSGLDTRTVIGLGIFRMSLIRCLECETPYVPGEALYCANCGTKLPDQSHVINQITKIEDAPRPYNALRFTSGLIITLGWVTIIAGWAFVLFWWTAANATYQMVSDVSINNPYLFSNISASVAIFIGLFSTVMGVLVIGAGQVYAVILDIRDDMNTTMQYVRYGLKRSSDK